MSSTPNLYPMFIIDPDEAQFIYEIQDRWHEGYPPEVAEEMVGTRISIGTHNVGSAGIANEGKADREVMFTVGIEIGKLVVALERDGKYEAAAYFIRLAAKTDKSSKDYQSFLMEGKLIDPNTGREVPPPDVFNTKNPN